MHWIRRRRRQVDLRFRAHRWRRPVRVTSDLAGRHHRLANARTTTSCLLPPARCCGHWIYRATRHRPQVPTAEDSTSETPPQRSRPSTSPPVLVRWRGPSGRVPSPTDRWSPPATAGCAPRPTRPWWQSMITATAAVVAWRRDPADDMTEVSAGLVPGGTALGTNGAKEWGYHANGTPAWNWPRIITTPRRRSPPPTGLPGRSPRLCAHVRFRSETASRQLLRRFRNLERAGHRPGL